MRMQVQLLCATEVSVVVGPVCNEASNKGNERDNLINNKPGYGMGKGYRLNN